MKKKVITFLMAVFLVMLSVPLPAEAAEPSGTGNLIDINETNFPDQIFRNYLSYTYDTDSDGKIDPNEVTEIDINGYYQLDEYRVKSLKGIELFPNLIQLDCAWNLLTSLDVSKNPNLTMLYCQDNQLTSLDVSKNPKLTRLYCEDNQLTSLDISKNPNLTNFFCSENQLTSLDVSKNSNLTEMYCYGNQLTRLNVSENSKLVKLVCWGNQLTSLDVSKNPDLKLLSFVENQLTSLDVSKNLNLTELYCQDNQLTSLDLSKNKELEEISCDFDSNLKELILPSEVKNLKWIYLHHSERIANLSKIKGLDFSLVKDSHFDKSMQTIDVTEAAEEVSDAYMWNQSVSGLSYDIYFYQLDTSSKPVPNVSVSYRTHVQSYGWQPYVSNGAMAGTQKVAKRLEGININVSGNSNLGIQYTTHVQSYGWLPWSSNGDMSGTEGEAKRLEAIKIQLTGADRYKYDVYYRVHAQSYGWLGWAKNGAPAGTAGYAKRLEAIQILVVKKGDKIDQNQGGISSARSEAYIALAGSSPVVGAPATSNTDPVIGGAANPNVSYRTHVQSFGWQGWKYNGQMSGTSGQAKRLEGINIKLTNKPYSGGICYTTHVQSYGWQGDINNSATWKKDGEMSGTSGQAKRLEAIMIKLTGEMAEHYDVYYRVHAQSYGWLGWAKNGAPAGTSGYAKRLEGIQIVLIPKGGAAPANNYGGINSANGQAYIAK